MSTDDRILDAALHVFEAAGFHAATTRRIAEEAGVNEVTLFRRYKSKQQLLHEAVQRHARMQRFPTLPAEPRDPQAELGAWALEHLEGLDRSRPLLRMTLSELEHRQEMCMPAHEGPIRVAAEVRAYLARLREQGLATQDWDLDSATWMFMGALFAEAMGRDMPGRPQPALADVARDYTSLFLRAIGVPTPPAAAPPDLPRPLPRSP